MKLSTVFAFGLVEAYTERILYSDTEIVHVLNTGKKIALVRIFSAIPSSSVLIFGEDCDLRGSPRHTIELQIKILL